MWMELDWNNLNSLNWVDLNWSALSRNRRRLRDGPNASFIGDELGKGIGRGVISIDFAFHD